MDRVLIGIGLSTPALRFSPSFLQGPLGYDWELGGNSVDDHYPHCPHNSNKGVFCLERC